MEDKKPKDTVLEVQDGTIDLSALFEHLDRKIKDKEIGKNGKAGS